MNKILRGLLFVFLILQVNAVVKAAIYTVDTNSDADNGLGYNNPAGSNSLRKCIRLANTNAGIDVINFALPAGSYTITLGSGLPQVTGPVVIDGTSQTGYTGTPLVNVYRNGGGDIFSLQNGSSGTTIKGLSIEGGNRAIYVNNSGSHTISGNFIGTNSTGTAQGTTRTSWSALQFDNSSSNTIGGTSPADRNIISGAGECGIRFSSGTCTGNVIINNYIGTDVNGTTAVPNGQLGILVGGGIDFSNSKIGGQGDSSNVISGNGQSGILFAGTATTITSNVSITNNYIGVDKSGNIALPNSGHGMQINNAANTLISGNITSANTANGISLINSPNSIIKGNKVGVGADGITALGNNSVGITIDRSSGTVIGGLNAGEGNLVINNKQTGINVQASTSVVVNGNVVAKSGWNGILINSTSSNALLQGNMVGLMPDGLTAGANGQNGIQVNSSTGATIGGTTPLERNIVSGNNGNGIEITGSSSSAVIKGNFVGLDKTGMAGVGNGGSGINVINNSNNVIIGGADFASRNYVAANKNNGIALNNVSNTVVSGNFSGLDITGSGDRVLGNRFAGIYLGSVNGATIGGSTFAERNLSSNNGFDNGTYQEPGSDGIRILGSSNLTIKGNWTGVDSTGLIKKGNSWGGISLNETTNSVVGETGPFEGNIASGNLNEGIYFRNAEKISLIGNMIGVGSDRKTAIGNEDYGINITQTSIDNLIQGNIIAWTGSPATSNPSGGNGGSGILIGGSSQRNTFSQNDIYCNTLRGIYLAGTANESVPRATLDYSDNLMAKGTGVPGNTIEVFRNPSYLNCGCQGEIYVGTTTVDGSGNWTLNYNLGGNAGSLTATQTTLTGSTSELSACCTPPVVTNDPTDKTVCPGQTTTFSVTAAGPILNYKWQVKAPADPAFADIANGGNYSGATTTTLTVSNIPVTMDKYQFQCVVYGCYPSDTSLVATLNVSHPVIKVSGDSILCAGTSTTLTATGALANSYTWSPATGLNTTTGAVVTSSPAADITYTIKGSDANGCQDSVKKTIRIGGIIPLTITGINTICIGQTTTLTASGADSYLWTPAATLSSATDASVTASPTATTKYYVTGDRNGCTGKDSITVTVKPLPVVNVSSTDFEVCLGDSVKLLTTSDGTGFSWSPSAGLSSASVLSPSASPVVDTKYIVTATLNGCVSKDSTMVKVNPLPLITGNDVSVCKGDPANLTASGAVTYTWSPATYLNTTTGSSVVSTPAAGITYTVTGTDANNCKGQKQIAVTLKGEPAITFPPPNTPICKGDSIKIVATGADTYSWSPGASLNRTDSSVVMAGPSQTTTYTVTGTSNGCVASSTITIQVKDLPVVTISADTFKICTGDAATLLTTSDATSFSWSPGTALSSTTVLSPSASPVVDTKYIVTATLNGCVSKDSTVVKVNPLPVISGADQSVCPTETVALTVSGANTYIWSPSTYLDQTNGATVNSTPNATITYTVTGTDNNGCKGQKQVLVTVKPVPVISIVPGTPTICSGQSVQLTASGANSYSWTPAATLDQSAAAVVIASPLNTTTYTVTGLLNGCSATNTVVVNVNPVPDVIVPAPSEICSGESTNVVLNSTEPGATFSWSTATSFQKITGNTPGSGSVIAQILKITGTAADTAFYTVTPQLNQCSGVPKTVKVTVHPLPHPQIVADDTLNFCAGGSVNLRGNPVNNNYEWSDGTTGNMINVTNTGNYYFSVTDGNGCKGSSDTLKVNVYDYPVVTLDDSARICFDEELVLGNKGVSGYVYRWSSIPSGFTSNEAQPTVKIRQDKLFILTVSNMGCTKKDSTYVGSMNGSALYIPNTFSPNKDGLNDYFSVVGEDITELKAFIFNRWGEKIYEWEQGEGKWEGGQESEPAKEDTYVYIINYRDKCMKKTEQKKGVVHLIR